MEDISSDMWPKSWAILRRKLPRDLAVAPSVRLLYLETWDALQAES